MSATPATPLHPALAVAQLNGLDKAVVERLFLQQGGVSQKDLLAPTGANQTALSRCLTGLIGAGIVDKQGATRGARFSLSQAARYWLTPPALRASVAFDPQRIEGYAPNDSQWLVPEARAVFDSRVGQAPDLREAWRRGILERFLVDLSWASSAFEGNTYSVLDTEVLVKYGQEADGKTWQEATMILNHKHAIDALAEMARSDELTPEMINELHRWLMRGLVDPARAGHVRGNDIAISSSAYKPCCDPGLLRQQLGSMAWKASRIENPGEASFFLLAGTSYLQAFEDGNKRLGRLLANWPLLRAGQPPLSFVGVDKRAYIQGMLEFYELGSTHHLGVAVADGYARTAHAYELELSRPASARDGRKTPRP